ncbi:gamma-crystallin N isoform X1 [Acinonyx jubatus]|uniref:Gamma-crystallin N isoform X1 n=1 Tax=Acinonyx jubatus TaxID=32536 RepID=A0ABM3PQ96_ACIJB|nr:gamma-crystallin N isoform X1 [Acinonyx jubatus]
MAQCSGKITFYEGKHFTGRKLEVYGDCDNFQDRGFMNRVNSIRVESGAWVCYDHPDFRGQQFILEHGNYPDFLCWNGHNDHMGSCRPVGMHGENFRMEIFEGCNFTGQCLEFQDDCPFLQSRGWAKNCVNAVKVYGDGANVCPQLKASGNPGVEFQNNSLPGKRPAKLCLVRPESYLCVEGVLRPQPQSPNTHPGKTPGASLGKGGGGGWELRVLSAGARGLPELLLTQRLCMASPTSHPGLCSPPYGGSPFAPVTTFKKKKKVSPWPG